MSLGLYHLLWVTFIIITVDNDSTGDDNNTVQKDTAHDDNIQEPGAGMKDITKARYEHQLMNGRILARRKIPTLLFYSNRAV